VGATKVLEHDIADPLVACPASAAHIEVQAAEEDDKEAEDDDVSDPSEADAHATAGSLEQGAAYAA
jgi:hypothetical protein